MSRPKCKIVKVWNEGDVVEDIGRGLFRLISKAPVSKPAKAPVKLPSKPQGSAQTAKQTITPSQPLRALRRTQSCARGGEKIRQIRRFEDRIKSGPFYCENA
jgi:hypothetical protein